MKNKRPSWNNYFMSFAKIVADRSTCLKLKVGTILVKDNKVLSTGYNGAPKGIEHCKQCIRADAISGQEYEKCRGVHAEQNAIIQAAFNGTSTKNCILYTTHYPCIICAKIIINAGIKKIFYHKKYQENSLIEKLLKEAKIETIKI